MVVAAMPSELRPFSKSLRLRRTNVAGTAVRTGRVGTAEVAGVVIGIGPVSASQATERIFAAMAVEKVVVIGIAGGLVSSQRIGDLVVPETVIDGSTGVERRPAPLTDLPVVGSLWTSGELILDGARLAALAERGVVALDMETAAVAEVCEEQDCPWSVVRAVSDHPRDGLVDATVLELTRPDGRPDLFAVARRLARHPGDVPRLARLGRDATRAADASARAAIRSLQA